MEPASKRLKPSEPCDEESSDDEPVMPSGPRVRTGAECPYIDTVERTVLDFDFEKLCSVTGFTENCYACLVCGKYYQGRGRNTPAYFHALHEDHHMFIKLSTEQVFCLPDDYEVKDKSLNDIVQLLNPTYSKAQIQKMDTNVKMSRSIEGIDYIPGLIGFNNLKLTDYANAVLQSLCRVKLLRDFFLDPSNYAECRSVLPHRFGDFVRKVWNPKNFRGHVSPHELMQTISVASKKRFAIGKKSDPHEFLAWLLDHLHKALGGTKEAGSSVIHKAFQGQVRISTVVKKTGEHTIQHVNFLFISMEVPPAPLFKDEMEKNLIPQVPLFNMLQKFDGATEAVQFNGDIKRFQITELPPYLVFHYKRFSSNKYFTEKNPTIVNFPVRNLDIQDYTDNIEDGFRYNLIANVFHEGDAELGVFKSHLLNKAANTWYDVEDLHIKETLPQLVSLCASYLQVYERDNTAVPLDDGKFSDEEDMPEVKAD
eukprot:TRINITY_DN18395_c0_g1_i6.p1 TRINITY_DN18395_c0_g1~~TRINITY_DN18395_c0_g1_i6.p1  ORF type:complete len:481 (+),score=122.03 TRINITY_DN18395_c0_g1_i6:312-1754(+)